MALKKLKRKNGGAVADARAVVEGRAIEATVPMELESTGEVRHARLREMAQIDFITDPEQRTIHEHYHRVDRPWRKHVELSQFYTWSTQSKWIERRQKWWGQIEALILAKRAERMATARISEIEAMESARDNMARYLFPLLNRDGSIKVHPDFVKGEENPLAGLPVYGLKMPSLDRFVTAFIALDKQIMVKRGEISADAPDEKALPPVTAHETDTVDSISPEDLRAMAKALVRRRQPELQEQPEITINSRREGDSEV